MNLADLKIVEDYLRKEITTNEAIVNSVGLPNFSIDEKTLEITKEYLQLCRRQRIEILTEIDDIIGNKLASL